MILDCSILQQTTWWETCIGANYRFENGLSIDAAVTSGLDVEDNFYIRGGRQKISKQQANDPILVARAKYTRILDLDLAQLSSIKLIWHKVIIHVLQRV